MFSPGAEAIPDGQIVLCVGNLLPIKGHGLLVRAIASLVPEFPALTLEIIGHGPEFSRLQALAQQLQIGERIPFWTPIAARSCRCYAQMHSVCFAQPIRRLGLRLP
jgi:glycosyltransferase involved in cell wall biosynthesis